MGARPAHTCARARYGGRRAHVSHFALAYPLTQLPFGFQIIVEETNLVLKNTTYAMIVRNTSQALHWTARRYLQPGESTQVGGVLDVNVGCAATAAAVRILGGLRHGGHCRCSSLGRQSALRYRSGTVRLVRARAGGARAPAGRRPRAAAPLPAPAPLQAPGRLELADRVTTPAHPPSQPFIDTPALPSSQYSFICFAQILAKPFPPQTRTALQR